jgi:hypothetical protein
MLNVAILSCRQLGRYKTAEFNSFNQAWVYGKPEKTGLRAWLSGLDRHEEKCKQSPFNEVLVVTRHDPAVFHRIGVLVLASAEEASSAIRFEHTVQLKQNLINDNELLYQIR